MDRWEYGLATYPGIKKNLNEDQAFLRVGSRGKGKNAKDYLLALVADGLGGADAGDFASETALEAVKNWWDSHIVNIVTSERVKFQVKNQFRSLFDRINSELLDYYSESGIESGTTLSILFIHDVSYTLAHVGDSRIYKINCSKTSGAFASDHEGADEITEKLEDKDKDKDKENEGSIVQLTKDHSFVAEKYYRGELSKEEARHHPKRNLLTNCLGINKKLDLFEYNGEFEAGDMFLLCSDGFYSTFSDEEILELVKDLIVSGLTLQDISEALVEKALQKGSSDDITVIMIGDKHGFRAAW